MTNSRARFGGPFYCQEAIIADIFDWSATAASNTTVDGININTGMPPGNVDNAFRSVMALIRNSFATALEGFLNGSSSLPLANGGTGGADAATARANIGLGTVAIEDTVPVAKGGTGGITAAAAFANIAISTSSLADSGYIKFTNGLLFQWGSNATGSNGNSAPINFQTAFTSSCFGMLATSVSVNPSNVDGNAVSASAVSTTQFVLGCDDSARIAFWFAVGI